MKYSFIYRNLKSIEPYVFVKNGFSIYVFETKEDAERGLNLFCIN